MSQIKKGITLVELIVSAMLTALVILSVWNIELAGRRFFQSSQKELELLNTLSFVMEHIQKNAYNGSGYVADPGLSEEENNKKIIIRQDDGEIPWNFSNDRQVVYRYRKAGKKIRYYADYIGNSDSSEVIAKKIVNCSFEIIDSNNDGITTNDNLVGVNLSARYDPESPVSRENPEVSLNSRFMLRSMSVR